MRQELEKRIAICESGIEKMTELLLTETDPVWVREWKDIKERYERYILEYRTALAEL